MNRFKYYILLIVLSHLSLLGFAQNRSIDFKDLSFDDALEMAGKQNKIIFIDCYTSWCGPCKMLAKDVFTNDEVADFFNENYISLKVDCEKGEGPKIASMFGVSGYPTLLFINPDKQVVHKMVGASEPKIFLQRVKKGFDPVNSLSAKEKRYEEGERDVKFLIDLMNEYRSINNREKTTEIGNEILSIVPEDQLFTKEIWGVVSYYTISRYDSKWWKFIIDNDQKYIDIIGENEFDRELGERMHPYLFSYIYGRKTAADRDEFNVYKAIVDKYQPYNKDVLFSFIRLGESRCFDSFPKYFKVLMRELKRGLPVSEHFRVLVNIFDYVYDKSDNKQKKQFKELIEYSKSLQNEYFASAYDEKLLSRF